MAQPNMQEVYDALRQADAAGDTESVRRLMEYIESAQQPTDDSALRGFIGGALEPVGNLARGLQSLPVVGPALRAVDEAGTAIGLPTSEEARTGREAALAANTRTGWQTAGNVAGLLPLARVGAPALGVYGNAALQGAAGGALLSDAESTSGVVGDAVIGGALGVGTTGILRGAANIASPYVSQGVRALREAGVPLTLGQLAGATETRIGRAVKGVEDRLAGFPIVGEFIQHARDRGHYAYNRAVLNRALRPVGAALPDDIPVGKEAIRYVGDELGRRYDELLPNLSAEVDVPFSTDLYEISRAMGVRPDRVQQQFSQMLDDAFTNRAAGGRLEGPALQDAQSKLARWASEYQGSRDPDQRALGAAAAEARDALRALITRHNPTAARDLRALDRGWRELAIAERAAARRATNATGVFTPVDYSTAAKMADTSARRRATIRRTAPNQRLTDAATEILPNTVPDSGTAGRTSLLSAARTAAGATGLYGAMTHPAETATVVGATVLGAVPYTQTGQRALNAAWTAQRPRWVDLAAEAARRAPAVVAPTAPAVIRPKRK